MKWVSKKNQIKEGINKKKWILSLMQEKYEERNAKKFKGCLWKHL